jgi:hypothetical protein
MATEDGPWLSGRSAPLGSMLHPSRHRRSRRFMRPALRRDLWSPDPRTFGGTRRALNDSPQEDPVETHLDILAVNRPLPAAVSGAPW